MPVGQHYYEHRRIHLGKGEGEDMKMRIGATTGWGPRAARVFSAAAGAVLVVVLAGCSLEGSMADAPPSVSNNQPSAEPQALSDQTESDKAAPPAFHFQSGDLVLGDFNYDEIAGNIFNPCEEISAEEFAAIGFETDGKVRRRHVGDIASCSIRSDAIPAGISQVVMGGSANKVAVQQQGGLSAENASKVIPNVYVYGPDGLQIDACYAAVDTVRGQLSVATGAVESTQSFAEQCRESVKVLEKLYELKTSGGGL